MPENTEQLHHAEDIVEPDATENDDQQDVETEDTFPREYVEKLRKENADARVKAKDRHEIAARLHVALVTATGRLADPTDLAFDEAHLEDAAALSSAIDALLEAKPHLASRVPVGDVGQGASDVDDTISLAGILRAGA